MPANLTLRDSCRYYQLQPQCGSLHELIRLVINRLCEDGVGDRLRSDLKKKHVNSESRGEQKTDVPPEGHFHLPIPRWLRNKLSLNSEFRSNHVSRMDLS